MSEPDGVLLPHGGYENLRSYTAPNVPPATPGQVRLTGLAGLAAFVSKAEPELAANAMLCAVNQASYLLKRQLESQSREFLEKGGFTENLHASRVKKRQSDRSDKSDPPDQESPACPACGKPMRRRTARTGPQCRPRFLGLHRLSRLPGNASMVAATACPTYTPSCSSPAAIIPP